MVASFKADNTPVGKNVRPSPRVEAQRRWFKVESPQIADLRAVFTSDKMATHSRLEPSGVGPLDASDEAWQEPTWDEVVIQLGQDIRLLREAQGLTLHHIHAQTKVPTYHLVALEAGQVEKMPEAIFVRGFLKRICTVLGEDGVALLAKLPDPKPLSLPQVAPARSHSSRNQLNAAHLYVGYAALLAGAVGGLAWVEQSEATQANTPSDTTHVRQETGKTQSPQANAQEALRSAAEMSPEQSMPEFS